MAPLPQHARLLLLPGLGTDPQILAPQARAFDGALFAPLWLQPHRREPLPDYAHRFAAMLGPTLDDGRPLFLGGVSFGGMVAYEMARTLRPRAVLLIASCRTGRVIPPWLVAAERVGNLVPNPAIAALRPAGARLLASLERLSGPERDLLLDIVRRVNPPLIRWSAWACTRWRDDTPLPDGVAVHHIHGDRDPLIPLRRVEPTEVVPGGRHLIHLTHAGQVNDWVRRTVEATLDLPAPPAQTPG